MYTVKENAKVVQISEYQYLFICPTNCPSIHPSSVYSLVCLFQH